MIEVSGLTFEYKGHEVLHDLSFEIEDASITALVGPNGAGKTTLLRCLAALETPVAGTILINKLNVAEHPRQIHSITGYLSDFFGLYNRLSVRQCLTYTARCHDVPSEQIATRVAEVSTFVDITPYLDQPAAILSRGYRQRLGIGLALINRPKILLLDEPASGMDPEARIGLSDLMLDLKKQGITIVVSSHILAELEDYCSDMLVIRDGRIADHVRIASFNDKARTKIRINIPGFAVSAMALVGSYPGVGKVDVSGDWLEFFLQGGEQARAGLMKLIVGQGLPVAALEVSEHTLQDAYMKLADEGKNSKTGLKKI